MSEGVTRRSVLRGLGASLGGALIDQNRPILRASGNKKG
jgi:hypothetical protein